MDFIFPLPEKVKEKLKQLNINDISLYLYSDVDLNMQFKKVHYVVSLNNLYVINNDFTDVKTYSANEIESIKIEYVLNYGRVYIVNKNKYVLIGYFNKSQSKYFSIFEKYCVKVLKNQMSEEDYNSKDIKSSKKSICPKCGKPYDKNTNYCKKCYGKSSTIFRLLKYIKNYKLPFTMMMILLCLSVIVSIFIPIFTNKILYNEVLDSSGSWFGEILMFTATFLLLKIISFFIRVAYGRISAKVSASICYDMKNDVFTSMQNLSLKFFKDKETGNLMNRVIWDVNMVFYYIVDDIPSFFINLMQAIGIVVYLMYMNIKLSLLIFIPIPIVILAFIKITPIFRRNWQQNAARNNELNNIVSDTLEGFRVVKVFSGHNKEIKRFDDISKRNTKSFINHFQFRTCVYPIIQFIISLSIFLVWGLGGYYVIIGVNNGGLDYGDFATFVAGIDLLYTPLEYMTNVIFSRTPMVLTSARRIFEISDATIDVVESNKPITLKDIKGDVEFKNVTFAYEINQNVIENVSFKVNKDTSLGIVGQTGAGKSTLMNLLARLYDVDQGEILIDGINIKELSLKTLHSNVSMISQDTYLFKGTIMDNIKFAKPNATFEEVINAAKIANAHDFIMKFENGYDTVIGQGATNLSGGERQRLSIARAVLVDAKIIIFDEATSAMDTITEKAIQDSINKLSKNRTVLMIAHRLSTLKDVDNLIVIDKKSIVEQGSMQELVELKGKFYELYTIQQEALKHIRVGD